MSIRSMHLLPRMNAMLAFIYMGLVVLRETSEKQNNTKLKILAQIGTRIHNIERKTIWKKYGGGTSASYTAFT